MMAREWHQRGPEAEHSRKPQGTPMRVLRSRRRRRVVHRWLRFWFSGFTREGRNTDLPP